MIVMLIIDLEQKKSIVTSGVMFMFFLVLSIFGILSFYTHISQAAGVCLLFFVLHFYTFRAFSYSVRIITFAVKFLVYCTCCSRVL